MKKLIAMIIIAITLGACSKSAGDNYLGEWKMDGGVKNVFGVPMTAAEEINAWGSLPIITITKSGDLYIIKTVNNSAIKMQNGCPTGATLKDSKLVCNDQFEISFDQTTNKLLTAGFGTFSKVSK